MFGINLSRRRSQMALFVLVWLAFTAVASVVMFQTMTDVPTAEELAQNPTTTPTTPPPTITPVVLPTLTPVPPVQIVRFDMGVFLQETQASVEEDVMRGYMDAARNQLNLNWVNVRMRWDFIEPEQGEFNWATWDRVFQLAAEYDLKVMATITDSPLWARAPEADPARSGPPLENAFFVDFVTTVLRRYPNQLKAVEIWEEPNVFDQWDTGPDPSAYVELLTQTAEAARAINPDVLIISAGLQPTSGGEDVAVDDFVYLDGLIEAGLLDVVGCVGVQHNGYNIGPTVPWDEVPPDEDALFRGPFDNPHHSWSFFSTLNTYARKIAAADSQKPLCVTEFGWATSEDLERPSPELIFANDNTLEEQGAWLIDATTMMEEWGFVQLAFINNMNAGPEGGFAPENPSVAYSLIRPDYAFSPAWLPLGQMNFRGRESE